MLIKFYCPSGHRLSVSEKHAGEMIRCPKCNQKAVVPETSPPARETESKSKEQSDRPESDQPPKEKTEHTAEDRTAQPADGKAEEPAKRSSKDRKEPASEAAGGQESASPEPKSARRKPPPLPPARKSPAAKHDPTQPKQKPVPKVEVPDRRETEGDEESVLDSEMPRSRRKLKPQRQSKEWLDSQPPKLPASKTPPVKAWPEAPPKTESAGPVEAEPEGQTQEQEEESSRRGRRDRRRSKRSQRDEAPAAETAQPPKAWPDSPRGPSPERTPQPRGPRLIPPTAYQADPGSLATVKGLAIILSVVVLFSLLPVGWLTFFQEEAVAGSGEEGEALATAAREYDSYIALETAPGWARLVILVAALQLFYIAWMLAAPDWAGVWVVMVVFALVSTAYGMATAMAIAWPVEKPVPLGMDPFRSSAKYWCGSVLAVMSLATYLCGRTTSRWRRICELEIAGRERARLRR